MREKAEKDRRELAFVSIGIMIPVNLAFDEDDSGERQKLEYVWRVCELLERERVLCDRREREKGEKNGLGELTETLAGKREAVKSTTSWSSVEVVVFSILIVTVAT